MFKRKIKMVTNRNNYSNGISFAMIIYSFSFSLSFFQNYHNNNFW